MIFHAYSAYNPSNPETQRRMRLAAQTWAIQPWQDCPVPESLVRNFVDSISCVPYIHDIIEFACYGKQPSDIIVLTNSDICVAPDCCQEIAAGLMFSRAVCGSRRDFRKLDAPLSKAQIQTGVHYPGTDLFAFRVGWWCQHKSDYPDLLLGREIWDLVMFCLMEKTNPGENVRLWNLIYHETHYQFWADPKHNGTLKSQLHNVNIGRQWMSAHQINVDRFSSQHWV